MIACCDRVISYTDGVSRETFDERGMVFDATVRNLELLGLRNVLIHSYFGVDEDILWDLVRNKVRPLRVALEALESQDS